MLSADGGGIEPFRVRLRARLMKDSKSEFNKIGYLRALLLNLVSFVQPATVIKHLLRK
jgi:hypothetical protein